jgi:hypothetical protein
MMCPDHGAVDHVGGGISFHHFRQRFEHRVEHAGRHPSSITPENAVPLAIFIGQVSPLRSRSGNPHHALEIPPIILRRSATATMFRR